MVCRYCQLLCMWCFSFRLLFSKKEKVFVQCNVLSMGESDPLQILCKPNCSEMCTSGEGGKHLPILSYKENWWSLLPPQKPRLRYDNLDFIGFLFSKIHILLSLHSMLAKEAETSQERAKCHLTTSLRWSCSMFWVLHS